MSKEDKDIDNEEEIYTRLRDAVDDSKYFDQSRLIEALKGTPPELLRQAADMSRVTGNEEFKKGNYMEALQLYYQAIIGNPDDARTYSNRAACFLALKEPLMALKDAMTATQKDESFSKGFYRKGSALAALECPGEAVKAYQEALRLSPNDAAIKKAIATELAKKRESDAIKRLQAQAMAGAEIEEHQKRGMSEAEAIHRAEQSIKDHEKSVGLEEQPVDLDGNLFRPTFSEEVLVSAWREAPNRQLKKGDLMGKGIHKLIKMRTELLSPSRQIEAIETMADKIERVSMEIQNAVIDLIDKGISSPSLLFIGAGACVLPIIAAKAGARVLVLEPSRFLARVTSQIASDCNVKEKITVAALTVEDCDWKDDRVTSFLPFDMVCLSVGLSKYSAVSFGALIIPSIVRKFIKKDGIILPRKIAVKGALVEIHLAQNRNHDLFDQYLWSPGETQIRLSDHPHKHMSESFSIFDWNLGENQKPTTDLGISVNIVSIREGVVNAIIMWEDLTWYKQEEKKDLDSNGHFGVQFLNPSQKTIGQEISISFLHNTTRVWVKQPTRIDDSLQTNKRMCPEGYIDTSRDITRLKGYSEVVKKKINGIVKPRILGIGTQLGLTGFNALNSGAFRFSAIDPVDHVSQVARQVARRNGIKGFRFTGTDVRQVTDANHERYDVIVAETIDNGGIGEGLLHFIEHSREHLLKENGHIVPVSITVRAVLIERNIPSLCGIDMNHLQRYLWAPEYRSIDLDKAQNVRVLTTSANIFHFDLRKTGSFQPGTWPVLFKTIDNGVANGIVFFFRLWLDEENYIDTAPNAVLELEKRSDVPVSPFIKPGISEGVSLEYEKEKHKYWTQGVSYFAPTTLTAGENVRFLAEHDKAAIKFAHVPKEQSEIRQDLGPDLEWAEMYKHINEMNSKISENIDSNVDEYGKVARKVLMLAGQAAWFDLHCEDALSFAKLFL